ncbi:hypothetical protein FRC07_007855, partial [Ceratobasidium sp. 392]
MPREVFLAPGGSPFVQNTHSQQHVTSDTDTSLPDLPSRYFRTNNNPDNLNSSRALAGLEDITMDMTEDESPMRFRSSVSDEMLTGIKGGEFLADDSAMGFDTSLVAKPLESRSKLSHSTSVPTAVAEEPESRVEAEQLTKSGKPKRKSTRSRSKSPSKKSVTPDPVAMSVESGAPFLREPMETMAEVPEPVHEAVAPEPEVKPRRTSPRKARTRLPSTTEPAPVFPIASSTTPPFNPFSASSTSEPVPPPEPALQPSQVDAQEPQATKPKRTSRTVGRSKSKTRSNNVPAEDSHEPQAEVTATNTTSVPTIENDRVSPGIAQKVSPSIPMAPNVHTAPVKDSTPPLAAPTDILPPAFIDRFSSVVKTTSPEPPSVHARAESGPAPFKFHAFSPAAKSRSKSLTPSDPHAPLVHPATSSVLASPGPDAPASDETPKEPTQEEAAEAVASALRILRRDSSIFPRLRQSIAPDYTPEPVSSQDNALAASQGPKEEVVPVETAHKRTRVGRSSTRVRGGAGVTTAGGHTTANRVIEEEQAEAPQKPEQATPEPEVLGAETAAPVEEASEVGIVEDIAVPVNFGSRTPSPTPAPTSSSPSVGTQPEPGPQKVVSDTKAGPTLRSRSSTAPNSSPPTSTAGTKPRATRTSLPTQATRPATRAARMSEGRPTVTRNVGSARFNKPQEPELVEEKEDVEMDAEQQTEPSVLIVDVPIPAPAPLAEEVAQPVAGDIPVEPSEPIPTPEATIGDKLEHKLEPGSTEYSNVPAPTEPSITHDAPVVPSKVGPVRTAPKASQRPKSTAVPKPAPRVLSRNALATQESSAPTQATTAAPSKASGATLGKGAPSAGGSTSGPTRPQRTITASSRKPSPSTSVAQKPPSTSGPTRVAVSQEDTTGSDHVTAKSKPDSKDRPTRTLPKRSAAMPKEQTMPELEGKEGVALSNDVSDEGKYEVIISEPVQEPNLVPTKAGPFQHAHGVFQPILNHPDTSNPFTSEPHTSPRPNKRPASPEVNLEHQIFDSPSKRVRFSAELEAGPTPARPGPSQ